MAASNTRERPRIVTVAAGLLCITLIGVILAWAKTVLIPIALAIFLTFILSPLVTRLDRWGLGRVPAVLVVVVAVGIFLAGLFGIVGSQLYSLANDLPNYQANIRDKIAALRASGEGGAVEKVRTTIEGAARATESESEEEPTGFDVTGLLPVLNEPVPVRVVPDEEEEAGAALDSFVASLTTFRPAMQVLATAGLALVLVIFMLITREDLRNRLVSLAAEGNLATTTKALDDAGHRMARYLIAQLIVNASFGVVIGIGLFIIGVPYALLWGLCAAIFRYIPYIGPWLAAMLPISVSLITTPDWTQVLMVLGLFVVLELASNNIMEPWLYGQGVGVSVVALIVSATFWAWIWGPVGLILATPLTVCLVVLGRHVPALSILDRLLGDRPSLAPHAAYLQRLLARDNLEAGEIVREYCRREDCTPKAADTVFDEMLIPALLMARQDRARGNLGAEEEDFILEVTRGIVDELADGEEEEKKSETAEDGGEEEPNEPLPPPIRILGCASHQEAEEVTLHMLDALMAQSNVRVDVLSMRILPAEVVRQVERDRPPVVVIAVLPPGGFEQARYLCRLLRKHFPDLGIVVGCWGQTEDLDRTLVRLRRSGAQYVTTTLLGAREHILSLAGSTPSERQDASVPAGRAEPVKASS